MIVAREQADRAHAGEQKRVGWLSDRADAVQHELDVARTEELQAGQALMMSASPICDGRLANGGATRGGGDRRTSACS
jgi:hypothetical protein